MRRYIYLFFLLFLLVACNNHNVGKTTVSIVGDEFYINGKPTFEGKTWRGMKIQGLLPNSRMINGIFDDLNPETVSQWKYPDTNVWSAERNTNEFVDAMSTWRKHGLLAFVIGMQGGSPKGYGNKGWINTAFAPDGSLRQSYMARLEKILNEADKLGMVVILQLFYFGQDEYLDGDAAILAAVDNTVEWVKKKGYKNILFEVVNECDNSAYEQALLKPDRVLELIKRVQSHSFLVSTSFNGRVVPNKEVCECADFILLHGNGAKSVDVIKKQITETKKMIKDNPKPVIYNEDDHYDFEKPMNNFVMATSQYVSWGYFDYRRKNEAFEEGFQSIPVDWSIRSERKRAFFNLISQW